MGGKTKVLGTAQNHATLQFDRDGSGAGGLPLARWHTDNHTLEPVPVYAQGAGAEYLLAAAKPEPKLGTYFNVPRPAQKFVDNTHIFRTAMHALGLRRH